MATTHALPSRPAPARLRPGTMVYDVHGDPEDPADTGTIVAARPGGYAVLWTGAGATPKFAATHEVAVLPEGP